MSACLPVRLPSCCLLFPLASSMPDALASWLFPNSRASSHSQPLLGLCLCLHTLSLNVTEASAVSPSVRAFSEAPLPRLSIPLLSYLSSRQDKSFMTCLLFQSPTSPTEAMLAAVRRCLEVRVKGERPSSEPTGCRGSLLTVLLVWFVSFLAGLGLVLDSPLS